MNKISANKKRLIIIILLITIMSVLSLANLGNRYLWYDEAHTALMGRNVLKYGVPKVWDGEYLITTSNGNDFNDSLIIVKDGFVQYYLAAFGELTSSFAHPRLIFVLLGIVGAIVFYLLTKQLTDNDKISLIALFLYCTSIPIILYIRQVRYYSPCILFGLLTLLTYLLAIKTNKLKHWIAFSISSILLYHSLYLFFMIIMIAIFIRYVLYDRNKIHTKGLLISLSAVFIFTFPLFLYNQSFLNNLGDQRSSFQGFGYLLLQAPGYLWQLNSYFFPFIGLGLIYVFMYLIKRITNRKKKILDNDMLTMNRKKSPNFSDDISCGFRDLCQRNCCLRFFIAVRYQIFDSQHFSRVYCICYLVDKNIIKRQIVWNYPCNSRSIY